MTDKLTAAATFAAADFIIFSKFLVVFTIFQTIHTLLDEWKLTAIFE